MHSLEVRRVPQRLETLSNLPQAEVMIELVGTTGQKVLMLARKRVKALTFSTSFKFAFTYGSTTSSRYLRISEGFSSSTRSKSISSCCSVAL